MTAKPFYLTTAIAYPNGKPHVGHAYEYISSDVIARFKRLDGFDVFFMTGTDEHGQKVQQAARKAGIETQEFVSANSDVFERLDERLGISFDRFIRTTDADHMAAATAMWQRMAANGDIYLDTYSGWYSVRDEAFYSEGETTLLDDGSRVSTESQTPVEWTEESNYTFRLSNYQDRLLELYDRHPEFLEPATRRNEIVSFVRSGLKDLSISRTTFDWGVPVPDDPAHVMYVWADALTNYLTGAGFPDLESASFIKYWPADLHIIGKDITRFHAVYWPAFLMSAGLELPRRIYVHGFVNYKGEKMSKSLGNVVDPIELIDEYGLDQLRYFLLREISYGQDGGYSGEAIAARINSDLANELGNLVQRSLTMVAKNCGATVPKPGPLTEDDEALLSSTKALLPKVRAEFERQQLHLAVEAIWLVLGETNRYFSAQQPWVLRKTDEARMQTVLWVTLEVLRMVGLLVQPVMPGSAGKILDLLGVAEDARDFTAFDRPLVAGTELPPPSPVFPRYVAPEA